MRSGTSLLLLTCTVFLTGCPQQTPGAAPGAVMQPTAIAAPDTGKDVVFERKVACAEATRAFVYDAISPREGAYVLARGCYVPTLNTCVAE